MSLLTILILLCVLGLCFVALYIISKKELKSLPNAVEGKIIDIGSKLPTSDQIKATIKSDVPKL